MTARGIRNNNAGNIRHSSSKWQGMSKEQTDSEFVQFDSMVYGIRALIKTLMTYHKKYDLSTVRELISRWAPGNENNTEAYVNSVSSRMGVEPDMELNFNSDTYIALAKAIAYHENGSDASQISDDDYTKAMGLLT